MLGRSPSLVRVRGVAGLTPLVAAVRDSGSVAAVRVLLDHGADPDAALEPEYGESPLAALDLATDPEVARLLVAAGASPRTACSWSPLHRACAGAGDPAWAEVAGLLLDRGADPGFRDEFGTTPPAAMGSAAPEGLRSRMLEILRAAGRSPDLRLSDVVSGCHGGVAVDPTGSVALSSMYLGAVLVVWRLAPTIEPARIIETPLRTAAFGPYGSVSRVVMVSAGTVRVRYWSDLDRVEDLPADLLPDRGPYPDAAWSGDGRLLALAGSEELAVIDTQTMRRHPWDDDSDHFGDWALRPAISPDGRSVAVGNTGQGYPWLAMLDIDADGFLVERYAWGLPWSGSDNVVGAVAFAPDGCAVAARIRASRRRDPPEGRREVVVVLDAATGDRSWQREFHSETSAAAAEEWWSPMCFTSCGGWLAIGLDTGVLWLDAATGASAGPISPVGAVSALAPLAGGALLASTDRGVHRVDPPPGL